LLRLIKLFRLLRSMPNAKWGENVVSIIRVGLGETKNFAEGYEAIFGKKKPAPAKSEKKRKNARKAKAKKK